MLSEYPYQSRGQLARRKPYSFAPQGGPDFLAAWRHARHVLLDALLPDLRREDREHPSAVLLEALMDQPFPLLLEALRARELAACAGGEAGSLGSEAMSAVQSYWSAAIEREGSVRIDLLMHELLRPCLAHSLPLIGAQGASAWATAAVDRMAQRFAVHGRIFARYDGQWRRATEDAGHAPAYAWLALATAWRAVSAWQLQRAAALRALNALLAVHDRVGAETLEGCWVLPPWDALALQASLGLELEMVASLEADGWSQLRQVPA